jgi:hypothetical protein
MKNKMGIRMKETYCAKCYRPVIGKLHKENDRIVFTMSDGEQAEVGRVFSHGNKYLLEFICCSDHKERVRTILTGTTVSV